MRIAILAAALAAVFFTAAATADYAPQPDSKGVIDLTNVRDIPKEMKIPKMLSDGVSAIRLPPGSPAAMVVLSYVIGSDGTISDAKIVISSGTPDFDAQVLTNYAQRLFRPAELAGKPVASRVAMRAVFVRSTGLGLLSIERDLPVHMVSDWIKYSQYLDSQYLWSGIWTGGYMTIDHPPSFALFRGRDDDAAGNHSEAIADFGDAIQDNPHDAIAFRDRGFVHEELGQDDSAVLDETQALSARPHYPEAMTDRAFAYDALGKHDLAAADYKALLGMAPACAPVQIFDDAACHDAYTARIAALDKRIAGDPNDVEAYMHRCAERAVANAGLSTALADCNRVLDILPDDPTALATRGLVFYRMEVFPSALKDYEASLKKDPHSANSLYMRGIVKTRLNDTAGGRADILAARAHEAAVAANMAFCGIYP